MEKEYVPERLPGQVGGQPFLDIGVTHHLR
jgi:hypothetical protein